jgi:hypothetical protein
MRGACDAHPVLSGTIYSIMRRYVFILSSRSGT